MNNKTSPVTTFSPGTHTAIPPWLTLSIGLLFGFSATTRSPVISIFAISYGLCWLWYLASHKPAGDFLSVYTAGTGIFGLVARTVSACLFMRAEDFQRRNKKKTDGERKGNKTWARVVWDSVEIGLLSTRGVGWNFQVGQVPPAPDAKTPRLPYILRNLSVGLLELLAIDISSYYMRHKTPVDTSLSTAPLTFLAHTWLFYLMVRWGIDAAYRLSASLNIALHIFRPSDFPPLFGSLGNAYTMKRFWGITWHQMMRTVAEPYTNALVRLSNLDSRRKSTYWVKVASAFFWAGAMHAYGALIAGGSVWSDVCQFGSQILAFWVEDVVIGLAKKTGIRDGWWVRGVGYVWVFVFQGATLWWYPSPAEVGLYAKHPLSVVEWVLEGR